MRETTTEPLIGQVRLQWWRDAIGAVFDGRPPAHPVATALAEVTAIHGLARTPFERMVDGRELELSAAPADDPATLESHAEATSSTLVGLALAVLGARGAEAENVALHGIAYVEPYLDRLSRAGDDPFDRTVALSRAKRQWRMTMSALRARI